MIAVIMAAVVINKNRSADLSADKSGNNSLHLADRIILALLGAIFVISVFLITAIKVSEYFL